MVCSDGYISLKGIEFGLIKCETKQARAATILSRGDHILLEATCIGLGSAKTNLNFIDSELISYRRKN